MPQTLAVYQEIASDSSASSSKRLQAANTIMSIYQRVLAADLESDRTQALRKKSRAVVEAARAERSRINLESKKVLLEKARTRRKYSRVLEKAQRLAKVKAVMDKTSDPEHHQYLEDEYGDVLLTNISQEQFLRRRAQYTFRYSWRVFLS